MSAELVRRLRDYVAARTAHNHWGMEEPETECFFCAVGQAADALEALLRVARAAQKDRDLLHRNDPPGPCSEPVCAALSALPAGLLEGDAPK